MYFTEEELAELSDIEKSQMREGKKECFKTRELMTTKHHVCCQCFHLFRDAQQTTCPTPGYGKTYYTSVSSQVLD